MILRPNTGRISAPPIRLGLEREDYLMTFSVFYEMRIHRSSRIRLVEVLTLFGKNVREEQSKQRMQYFT
jgi:hypothetical protein